MGDNIADGASLIPCLGEIIDVGHAAVDLACGDYGSAALHAVLAVPGLHEVGDLVKDAKWAVKGVKIFEAVQKERKPAKAGEDLFVGTYSVSNVC